MGDTLREVYLSGKRAEDMALRFLYEMCIRDSPIQAYEGQEKYSMDFSV